MQERGGDVPRLPRSFLTQTYKTLQTMNQVTSPVNNEIVKIVENNGKKTVDARELHQFLGSKRQFGNWIKQRIEQYDFVENQDFEVYNKFVKNSEGGRPTIEYALSIEMAKELSMIENNEQGRVARRYFIECEKLAMAARKSSSYLIEDPIERAERWIEEQKEKRALELENKAMKPKAEYFDDLVERNMLTGLRDTAKELGWKQNAFITQLIKDGYLYRNNNKSLRPKAEYANDLFVLKDSKNDKTKWVGVQTLVTPKGKETLRLLYMGKAIE